MEEIRKWMESNTLGYGSGDGSGDGDGYGYGYGYGYGSGHGYGSGYGSGSGDGSGDGDGYGSGHGYGSDYGSGYGDGSGFGLKTFDGKTIYNIDNIPTIITSVKLALAKGFILESDLSLTPCYIAKGNGYFAHGKTVNEAREALQAKIFENMDTDEAITKFLETFKKGERYSGKDFFEWHHYLTGSCLMGRESFVSNRGLDVNDMFTVDEFIALCENDYGGDIIKQLKERYNNG